MKEESKSENNKRMIFATYYDRMTKIAPSGDSGQSHLITALTTCIFLLPMVLGYVNVCLFQPEYRPYPLPHQCQASSTTE